MTAADHLDAAVLRHMAHGAMASADPLTDSMLEMVACYATDGGTDGSTGCATEGALPAVPYASGLRDPADDAASDPWLRWVWPVGVAAGLLLSALATLWPTGGA